jgi:hypothetical protein
MYGYGNTGYGSTMSYGGAAMPYSSGYGNYGSAMPMSYGMGYGSAMPMAQSYGQSYSMPTQSYAMPQQQYTMPMPMMQQQQYQSRVIAVPTTSTVRVPRQVMEQQVPTPACPPPRPWSACPPPLFRPRACRAWSRSSRCPPRHPTSYTLHPTPYTLLLG